MNFSDIPIIQVEGMPKNEMWFGYIRDIDIDYPNLKFGFEVEGKIINIKEDK